MTRRLGLWGGLGAAGLFLILAGGGLLSLPPTPAASPRPPIARQEIDATLRALAPPKRARPLIAIIGINDATETNDYLTSYGILKRADVADVVALATGPGPMRLYPALKLEPQATIADFDLRYPNGADYVVVPAMTRDDDPVALRWIQQQARSGAIIIGVCAGAKVLGAAGLLDGKRATTHWYYLEALLQRSPSVRYVPNRRFVVDQGVATTTGITASMPMMLTLIEAIAGTDRARRVAEGLGVSRWDARHDSRPFTFTRPFALTVIGNTLAFWNRDQWAMPLRDGVDEVSLALTLDAWSRTYRSTAITFAASASVASRGGIRLLADQVRRDWPRSQRLPPPAQQPPAGVLDQTLREIRQRYGQGTARVVAMQLEYPWDASP
ncbi:DJ-1/PfpI family protein [Alcanivorax sp. 24]|uniref:DJ-1/PfpI family protein n=1 Tax=Alcanivorax sp. 24 TaxID=2545266 RepID=UPI00105CD570|nr:DJ-1/PfpI family protein [Alcanivorax sp. 24]